MNDQRGAALAEFAIVWPVLLVAALGAVELSIWSAESAGARSAALAGARAGSISGTTPATAQSVAVSALRPLVAGAPVTAACPGLVPPAGVWVCATDLGSSMEVTVGGTAPALVPLLPSRGLPLHADARVPKEVFT